MIGNDTIMRRGEQLIICSKVDMHDWQVQQIRKTAIYVDDEAWCLVGKQHTATKEVRYLLDFWPDLIREIPGRRIRYDEAYVRARNEAAKKRRLEVGIGPILYHLRAVIGFLPSRVKSKIETVFGIPARNATLISILIELPLFFVLGAFLQIFVYGSMHAPNLVVFIPTFIVLVPILFVDLIMRYHSYLREDASPLGALEWIVRWKAPKSPTSPFKSGNKDDVRTRKAH
jgi:hypothetical protein